jgi:ABC-2 type transport system ATP-binding protein
MSCIAARKIEIFGIWETAIEGLEIMDAILEVNHLYKTYRGRQALKDVTLSFEKERIYGLIGQNGAGKTTLMRMIAGLTFPDSGSLTLFGKKDTKSVEQARKKVGFLIENPALYSGLSAQQNMKIQQMLKGYDDKNERVKLLQRVNLTQGERKKVRDFSLGMKQRLGIALALVGHPDLLVLDEPINGLDPEGIVDVRNLLKELMDEGTTILLSSHILSELMNVVTDFVFMDHGEVIEQDDRESLMLKLKKRFCLRTSNDEKALLVLSGQYVGLSYKRTGDALLLEEQEGMSISRITKILDDEGIVIQEIREESMQLDEYFLSRTGRRCG